MKKHNYREEFRNRTIKPSLGSWEKLDKKLTAAENQKKGGHWKFLKIASVLLVFLSISWYFYNTPEDKINSRIIAAPSAQDDLNKIPDLVPATQTEIADNPDEISTTEKYPSIDHNDDLNEKATYTIVKVNTETVEKKNTIANNQIPLTNNETESEEIIAAEIDSNSDSMMDQEIEQLLHQSKIKLIVNGQISSKKLVNADALLNSVEDDMNKSLKQKLLDKIATTLKKEREVASSKEN